MSDYNESAEWEGFVGNHGQVYQNGVNYVVVEGHGWQAVEVYRGEDYGEAMQQYYQVEHGSSNG